MTALLEFITFSPSIGLILAAYPLHLWSRFCRYSRKSCPLSEVSMMLKVNYPVTTRSFTNWLSSPLTPFPSVSAGDIAGDVSQVCLEGEEQLVHP